MPSTVRKISRRHLVFLAAAVGSLAAGAFAISRGHARLALAKAQEQYDQHLVAQAVETLEPVRGSLTSTEKNCSLLARLYFDARRADRLEWAMRSCLESHIETCEVYIGQAAALELSGKDDEALKLLELAARRFDASPDAYYRMAVIYRRKGWRAELTDVTFKAAERFNSDPLALEALQLLSEQDRWADAFKMAERLKDAKLDDPEAKLQIARALLHGGDQGRSHFAVLEARSLMKKKPELKARLETLYSDVLAGQPQTVRASAR